jgi:hypothetical protein
MGRACRTYGEDEKAYKILFGKSERKKLFESLVSDTKKIFKLSFKKCDLKLWA